MRLRQRLVAVFTAAVTSLSIIVSPISAMAAEDTDTSVVAVEEAALPCGLSGMPDGFMISSDDIRDKEEAAAAGMLDDLSRLVPGKDYIDRQIVYTAHDREYAEQVAKAYNAELISFGYGVAVAQITDENISVADAVAAGLDTSLNLPIVSPNHLTPVEKPVISNGASSRSDEVIAAGENTVDQSAGWKDALDMLEDPDPFLKPGAQFYEKDPWNPDKEGEEKNAYQWMHDMVGTYEAWWTSMGSNNVTVAVIDSGVDTDHEDLTSSADGRGVWNVTDVYVNPTVEGTETYRIDNDGHGTHVAGIIGATAGNGKGGAGIAPGVNILGVAILTYYGPSESGNATASYADENIARAINYVAGDNDDGKVQAQIINMSIGGALYNQTISDAIKNAYDKDITVVASMGNPDTNAVYYPAGYDHVIAVSAVDQAGNKTFFSSYGDWADIAAPGIDIVSTWNGHSSDYNSDEPRGHVTEDHNDWYASWPGTSMAAPVVAGACALYMSVAGNTKPDDMESILKSTATKVSDKSLGAGIVNVAAMIGKDVKPAATVITRSDTKDGEYTEVKDGDSLNSTDFIKFSAPEGDSALFFSYTVNGKKPAFKDDAVAPGCWYANENAIPVSDLVKNGAPEDTPFTLKSVYMNPHGVIGTVTPITITILKDPTAPTVSVYGSEFIARSKSITYTAATDPAGSISRGITWSLGEGADPGISINEKTGKVTVKKSVEINTKFSVVATLGDTSVTGQKEVTVKDPLTGITVDKDKTVPKSYDPVYKKGSLNSVRLYTVDVPGTEDNESKLYLPIDFNRPECYESTENSTVMEPVSSRPGVAYAEWDDEKDSWYIQSGRVAGTTKITWSTDDGSGKKATVTVKTIVPVSSVTVKTKNYQEFVSYGKSIQFVGVAGYAYGKPSVPKLSWDYEVTAVYTDPDTDTNERVDVTNDWKSQGLAKITQSGKLTVNKKAANYLADEKYEKWDSQIQIKATAKATDGSGEYGYNTVIATNPTQEVRWRLIQKDTDGNIPEGGDSGWLSKSGTCDTDLYLDDADKNLTNYIYVDTNGSSYTKSEMCIASSSKPRSASLLEPEDVVLDEAGQEVKEGDNTVTCLKYMVNTGSSTEFTVGRTETVKFSFIANDGSGKKNTVTLKIHVQ